MRAIIAGGGTGGHVFPAISIADELASRSESNEILFVGSKRGLENTLVPKSGYEIRHVSTKAIKGLGPLRSLLGVIAATKGLVESLMLLRSYKPDFVLGVGGYVSGPLILAAVLLRLPTAVCEQNTVPGITNRILGRIVGTIYASFEESLLYFPQRKVLITGNPVRPEILKNADNKSSAGDNTEDITILIFGGSQGAGTLNKSVPDALGNLGRQDIRVIHQTGNSDYESVARAYDQYRLEAEVLPFIDDMAEAYARSDLVIGRAGAGTIAEITALGKPSILIPFPYATNDHQMANARVLSDAGAARVLSDKYATAETIAELLSDVLDKSRLLEMSQAAVLLGKPDAAQRIVDSINEIVGEV